MALVELLFLPSSESIVSELEPPRSNNYTLG